MERNGFTLIEVVVVLLIASVSLGALIIGNVVTLRSSTYARNKTVAEKLASRMLEEARIVRERQGWSWMNNTWGFKTGCTLVNTTTWTFDPPQSPCTTGFSEVVNGVSYRKELYVVCTYNPATLCTSDPPSPPADYFNTQAVVKWDDRGLTRMTSLRIRLSCRKGEGGCP